MTAERLPECTRQFSVQLTMDFIKQIPDNCQTMTRVNVPHFQMLRLAQSQARNKNVRNFHCEWNE